MKALITGAAGFMGTNLSIRLLKNPNNKIIGVDSLIRKGSEENLKLFEREKRFKFYQADIDYIEKIIKKTKPDVVYHLAAQVAVTSSVENPKMDFEINALGTLRVVNTASQIKAPVIYTSTNKVYGDNLNKVPTIELVTRYDFGGKLRKKGIGETFSIDAKHHTPYGCSKLTGDIYVRDFGGIVNRCSCMYGVHQHGTSDQGWLSYFAKNKILGKEITIYGDGKQVRDAVRDTDVTRLLEMQGKALLDGRNELRGEVFNVGGGYKNTISLLELCTLWDIKPKFKGWRPSDQKVFYCDTSKADKMLNWRPEIDLKTGLDELFRWTNRNQYT
ncbi:GDP-mannose 4,6-dehydratase [Candidatus Pacearchaeota archaeon]|nr:GDP-mannose 4,6-dehydratase [Candidatus Pacearchaeota archaeon]